MRGVAVTPIEHGQPAIDVMREAKDLGLVATLVPPALKERNLDHPDLDPFYAAAVELGMPLGVHGAPGIHLPKIGVDRFTNYIQVHCISFPFDQMTAMTAMVSGGVFDRHSGLRVAFLDAGVGWVPFFIDTLDSRLLRGRHRKRCVGRDALRLLVGVGRQLVRRATANRASGTATRMSVQVIQQLIAAIRTSRGSGGPTSRSATGGHPSRSMSTQTDSTKRRP